MTTKTTDATDCQTTRYVNAGGYRGDIREADELLAYLVDVKHPTRTSGDWDTIDVTCPWCGQVETWDRWEERHHGRCRTEDHPCECDEEIAALPTVVHVGHLHVPDEMTAKVEDLFDRDAGYLLEVEGPSRGMVEIDIWREAE